MLLERAGPDGLIASNPRDRSRDLVDWPPGERDGHVFTRHNTVVNAFHLKAVSLMAEMADALGNSAHAAEFHSRYEATLQVFHQKFFNEKTGIYHDGTDTTHSSVHSSLFPLAFRLVPPEHRPGVAAWLVDRGMKCSIYAAQYLLEGLFENGMGAQALQLIIADNDRSWKHLLDS